LISCCTGAGSSAGTVGVWVEGAVVVVVVVVVETVSAGTLTVVLVAVSWPPGRVTPGPTTPVAPHVPAAMAPAPQIAAIFWPLLASAPVELGSAPGRAEVAR
jgi:hypothetical protein